MVISVWLVLGVTLVVSCVRATFDLVATIVSHWHVRTTSRNLFVLRRQLWQTNNLKAELANGKTKADHENDTHVESHYKKHQEIANKAHAD